MNLSELLPDAQGSEPEMLDYFGVCPVCFKNDGYINHGPDHWFVCHDHRVAWCVGANLFSGWRGESRETWARNLKLITSYGEIEPAYDRRWNAPREVQP